MPGDPFVDDLLMPGRRLRDSGNGIRSAMDSAEHAAHYNRRARLYDRIIGSARYNRLVWQASPHSYSAFAATAVASGSGPLLDVGCGSAVFTAEVYRASTRPLVLLDSSQDMLARAAERVGTPASGSVAYLHADLSDLPFRPRLFPTVACHGVLHLFTDLEPVLHALRAQVAPGGTLYATSLVAESPIGSRWLRVLHRAGETAPPRRVDELEGQVRAVLGDNVRVAREGCMGFLTATL